MSTRVKAKRVEEIPNIISRSIVNLEKLPKVEEVMAGLRCEHKAMDYYMYDEKCRNVAGHETLNLEWDPAKMTYYGTFEGKRLPMGQTAVDTALKFCKIPNGEWLLNKPPQRLVETIGDQAKKEGGMQVAVNNNEIKAFVTPDFVFMSDYELLQGACEALRHLEPQGVEVIEHPDTDGREFRLVFGNSVVKRDEIRMMMSITSSEFGLSSNVAYLGGWRIICMNGMLSCEKSHVARWNHRGTKGTFIEKMSEVLLEGQAYGEKLRIMLDLSMNTKLAADAEYIALAMQEMKLLKPTTYDVVSSAVGGNLIETAYDFWNLMTDTAKTLDMHGRHRLEQAASKYLTQIVPVNKRAIAIFNG